MNTEQKLNPTRKKTKSIVSSSSPLIYAKSRLKLAQAYALTAGLVESEKEKSERSEKDIQQYKSYKSEVRALFFPFHNPFADVGCRVNYVPSHRRDSDNTLFHLAQIVNITVLLSKISLHIPSALCLAHAR
ncbi:hypothetical protein ALC60_07551 [Trachymyrmex zeteki]|uniref:Uncharacterized protein n=1 Tax=Mycetomoellerius zeteki TaxID=64791 RepID=A0A151X064_9HYME|nr:hypothetical protein ALC60_07551 [Trachymyrmex zeteki]